MKIESIRTTPLLAPLSRPLTNASGIIEKVPLVLVDLVTDAGITGRAYVLVYFPQLLKGLNETVLGLGEMVKGMNVVPREINAALHRRTRLLGTKNLVGMALAGIDMAAWDAFARAQKLPLAELLGGTRRPLPTYNSLGLYNAKTIPQACEETLARGFAGMKVKTGWPNFVDDLGAVREAKKRLGDKVALMIDFNQSLTRAEALARCRALDDEGLVWIEEPIAADDHIGCAQIAVEIKTPIQIGENFQGPFDMANALRANAADFVMPDPQMIQGVTGWLDAATLAHTAGLPMSSHCFVEPSAHLLCVTPTAHWLEYMDWVSPLIEEPYKLDNGMICAPNRPGLGLDWDEDKIKHIRL
jgi:mandelate racemase